MADPSKAVVHQGPQLQIKIEHTLAKYLRFLSDNVQYIHCLKLLAGRIGGCILATGEVAAQFAGQVPSLSQAGPQWFRNNRIPFAGPGTAHVWTYIGGLVFLFAGLRTIWAAVRLLFYTSLFAYLCAKVILLRSQ